jgi:NADPH-dependent ferric siderophore reductase
MAERPERRSRPLISAEVLRTERVTPHMIRVVLGGAGLAGFTVGEYTDLYVKLQFKQPGVVYPEPFDLEAVRRDLPREQWPKTRTYTIRSWDPAAGELAIDFVHHGDEGIAGPWAAAAQPGDTVHFSGPGGGYAPSAEADWHLLAGDESALPAISAALERLPEGATAHVFIEVADAAEEQKLSSPGAAEIVWLHRGDRQIGAALVEAVRGLEFGPGAVHAFVHGEANFVKELRHCLKLERGLDPRQHSISGYWRRGTDEDGWQSTKGEWNRQVEAEEQDAATVAAPPDRTDA